MKYQVILEKRAEKFLAKLNQRQALNITDKLLILENFNQFTPNIKKLSRPLSGYRLRIGDFRALFVRDDKNNLIEVYLIDYRKQVYRA